MVQESSLQTSQQECFFRDYFSAKDQNPRSIKSGENSWGESEEGWICLPHTTLQTPPQALSACLGMKKDIELIKGIYLPVKAHNTKAAPLHNSLLDVLIQVGSGSLLALLHTCA